MKGLLHSEKETQETGKLTAEAIGKEPLSRAASALGATATAAELGVTGGPVDEVSSESNSADDQKAKRPRHHDVDHILANVYHDPTRHTVTLLMDEAHANAVIYAARVVAADYEAHAREVRAVASTFPPDSYGAKNRLFIAIRHERIASKLRRVESNYRAEVSEGWA